MLLGNDYSHDKNYYIIIAGQFHQQPMQETTLYNCVRKPYVINLKVDEVINNNYKFA